MMPGTERYLISFIEKYNHTRDDELLQLGRIADSLERIAGGIGIGDNDKDRLEGIKDKLLAQDGWSVMDLDLLNRLIGR